MRLRGAALGYAMVLAAAVLFGVNATVSKVTLESGLAPIQLTVVRVVGTAVVLLVVIVLIDSARMRVSWRELPALACYGVIGVALIQCLYFVAIDRLPVGIAVLLEFTGPVLVALYARLVLGQQVRRRLWLAIALSLGGLALVAEIWQTGHLDRLGLLAGAGAAFALAAYYLMGEKAVRRRDPLSVTTYSFLFGALFWLVLQPRALAALPGLGEPVGLLGSLDRIEVPVWSLLLWIVVLGTLVPFLLSICALQRLTATQAGVVAMMEPVLAAAIGWVWLGQALTAVQLLGGSLVVAGVGLAQTARGRVPELRS